MNLLTCKSCGWVHFGVSREYAENEIRHFNEYFESLTEKERQDYYGGRRSSIKEYDRCDLCGGSYKNFRPAEVGDCPNGVTLGPIITEDA